MPETLESLPKVNRPGRKPAHPYDEWFAEAKKSPIKLVYKKDFNCKPKTMQHNIYRHARQRGLRVPAILDGNDLAIENKGKRPVKKNK